MERATNKSIKQKIVFAGIHFISIVVAFWIIFLNGQNLIAGIFGQATIANSDLTKIIIFICALVYFVRHIIALFFFIKREVAWGEAIGVGFFIAVFQILFAILAIYNKEKLYTYDWVLLLIYFFGSFLNTFSELRRMIWKKDQANKGKLYTQGLFKYSMHINYFGDTVLFTAFALLTGSFWALSVPILITLGFIFYHIPELDNYLRNKYNEQFTIYENKTKKFIPWLY